MKRTTFFLTLIVGATILAGCGRLVFLPQVDMQAGFTPTNFGFEIDQQGRIIVAAHIATLSAKQGSMGVYVDGYRIDFYDASGNPLFPGDSTLFSRGSLNVYVPPGITCDLPDPNNGCTSTSAGATFAAGPQKQIENFIDLPSDMIDQILALLGVGGAVGARGEVFFYGTDTNGYTQILGPYEVGITFPVGAE